MTKRPTRLEILHALRDDGATEAALKYLVLYQNVLQESPEFSFLPVPMEDYSWNAFEPASPQIV
jgi:hypothetical protein